MTKYKPRTPEVDAIQWTGDNNAEVAAFLQAGPMALGKNDLTFGIIDETPVLQFRYNSNQVQETANILEKFVKQLRAYDPDAVIIDPDIAGKEGEG